MATLVLQQVSSRYARENEGKTLDKPIALKHLRDLKEEQATKLAEHFPSGHAYIWGSKFERVHQYGKIPPSQSLVLFRRGRSIYKCGVVVYWLWSEAVAECLWGRDVDGKTWELLYFLEQLHDISFDAPTINRLLGSSDKDPWRGFRAISTPNSDEVVNLVASQVKARSNIAVERDAGLPPK